MIRRSSLFLFAFFLAAASLAAQNDSCGAARVQLKKSFLKNLRDRVLIPDANFQINGAHESPNDPEDDADLHFAGLSSQIRLPVVAEIMNAKGQPAALSVVKSNTGPGKPPVKVSGAWRIWPEHPPKGNVVQVQGANFPVTDKTNPDHVFEIHPVTQIAAASTTSSFKVIPGYSPKNAADSFRLFEQRRLTVSPSHTGVLLCTKQTGNNYVRFRAELDEDPKPTSSGDGFFAQATLIDSSGDPLLDTPVHVRLAFASGTPPADRIASGANKLKKGSRVTLLGIPRLNLKVLFDDPRINKLLPYVIPLPYEMIVVGIFP